jgi:hypothetical protein
MSCANIAIPAAHGQTTYSIIGRLQWRSEKLVQHQRFKASYPREDRIVCNQTSRLGVEGGRGLKGIRSSQAIASAKTL